MTPWLSADLADQHRDEAQRAADRDRLWRPRPPSKRTVWATCLVPVPYGSAVLTLPVVVRSHTLRIDLLPVHLRSTADRGRLSVLRASGAARPAVPDPLTADSLRILTRWSSRSRNGDGYLELLDAGDDGVELILQFAARRGRRLGRGVSRGIWPSLNVLRTTMVSAASAHPLDADTLVPQVIDLREGVEQDLARGRLEGNPAA